MCRIIFAAKPDADYVRFISFQRAGITHLKLVGRGNYVNYMENDIRNLKQALELLDCAKNEADFINKMKAKLFEKGCSGNCYYETYGMKK